MFDAPEITPTLAAGDIEGLLAFHRSQFGSLRMEGDSGGDGAGQGTGNAGGGAGGAGYTPPATQADLDRIVESRLARDRAAKFGDYDELKDKASKWEAEQAKNQSDLEKSKAAQSEAEKRAQAAEERASKTARDAAVIVEAAKLSAKNPQHIVALLPADAVTVDKDGNVNGADAAVKKFAEENPDYFGTTTTTTRRLGPPSHGQGAREATPPAPGSLGKAEAERRFGAKK